MEIHILALHQNNSISVRIATATRAEVLQVEQDAQQRQAVETRE